MTYSAPYPYGPSSTDPDRFADQFLAALDVAPSDRIGPPRRRPVARWLTWSVVGLGVAAAAALHADDPERWPRWWAEARVIAAPLIERATAAVTPAAKPVAAEPPASARDPASMAPPGTLVTQQGAVDPHGAPATAAQVTAAAEPVETAIAPPPAVAAVEDDATPAATAAAKRTADDPDRARAVAAGLHADISRVLLARLSDADYRNAAHAISKALAETPDDNVLYWPLKTKPGVAQFQIHFVPGADEGCRRYVVTIAKDGWATTSLPMDKCGVARKAATESAPAARARATKKSPAVAKGG